MAKEQTLDEMLEEMGGDDIAFGELDESMDEEEPTKLGIESDLDTDLDIEDDTVDFREEEEDDDISEEQDEDETGTVDETGDVEDESEDDNGTEQSGDEKDSDEDTEVEFKPIPVTIAGQELMINSQEELDKMIKAGVNSFGKEEKPKSERDIILEKSGLTNEDLKLLAEAKSGNKEALAKLAKNSNVNLLEIDNESEADYKETLQFKGESELDFARRNISNDQTHAQEIVTLAENLPESFTDAIMNNAGDLKAFSEHVKLGVAQQIIPEAMKASMLNGRPFMENYLAEGKKLAESRNKPEPIKQERRQSEAMKEVRKRAGSGKGSKKAKVGTDASDVWDMKPEDFEKEMDSIFS